MPKVFGYLRSPMKHKPIEEYGAVGLHEQVPVHAKYVLPTLCSLLCAISCSPGAAPLAVTPCSSASGHNLFLCSIAFFDHRAFGQKKLLTVVP
jgi:hypothetical protein